MLGRPDRELCLSFPSLAYHGGNDRLTFAMTIGVPVLQLVLFGYAINADPKGLPDRGGGRRQRRHRRAAIVAAMENTRLLPHRRTPGTSEAEAEELLERGEVQFIVTIPPRFHAPPPARRAAGAAGGGRRHRSRGRRQRHRRAGSGRAQALAHDLTGPLAQLQRAEPPFEMRIHRRYNPEGITQYNIVPGLMGMILP